MAYFLSKSVGAWAAGTRVVIVDNHESGYLVRVIAGDKPLIEVSEDDIVERRKGRRMPSDQMSEK